jgi:hypothetical protein
MKDLVKAAEALLTYIKEEDVYDTLDDDGDGYTDCSQSHAFKELTNNLQHAIEDAAPLIDAINLIKEGFITIVQTAIARQSQ